MKGKDDLHKSFMITDIELPAEENLGTRSISSFGL